MKKMVYAKCPYCNFVNKWTLKMPKRSGSRWSMHYCEVEEGGCDELFAVHIVVSVAVETAKITVISGE